VLSLTGNEQLVRVAEDLHRRSQWPLVGGSLRPARADLAADAAEHAILLDALIARDVEMVRSLVAAHCTGAA
jgi:DNA-binding GntR family transcriptional regulator